MLNTGTASVLGSDKRKDLDKWKNTPMLHAAYQRYPDAQWFVFIDADTYISWINLLQLLGRLDSTEPLYFGAIFWYGETKFAHDGSGYGVSKAAAERFEEIRDAERIAAWEYKTSTICCGDVMLSVAWHDAGVNVSGAGPLVQHNPPSMFDWWMQAWCTPAVSWHHVRAFEVEALWHFEQAWINQTKTSERVGHCTCFSLPPSQLMSCTVTDLTFSKGWADSLSIQGRVRILCTTLYIRRPQRLEQPLPRSHVHRTHRRPPQRR